MAMTQAHKDALAQGRREARAVKSYLEVIGSRKPGRPVTVESVRKRLEGIEEKISAEENELKKVDLIQARLDAEEQLAELEDAPDVDALEQGFVEVAKSYSERKGISYTAWREAGVPAAVLKDAGVPRTRRS
jgi:hypothetical protein